jgi:hypothetical protein
MIEKDFWFGFSSFVANRKEDNNNFKKSISPVSSSKVIDVFF